MYTAKDFNNLQFNPLSKKPLLDEYPILMGIVNVNDSETDVLLRFVILCYDPKSKLAVEEKDLNHRKAIAAELSGIREDIEYQNAVFTFALEQVARLTLRYLIRFVKSKEWAAIIAIEYKYWENISELTKPIEGSTNKERLEAAQKKAIISDEVEKDIKRIDNLYKTFFGDDQLETAVKQSSFTAERIAFGDV